MVMYGLEMVLHVKSIDYLNPYNREHLANDYINRKCLKGPILNINNDQFYQHQHPILYCHGDASL